MMDRGAKVAVRRSKYALYMDTSALIKLFVEEDGSARVRGLAQGRGSADILLVSRLGFTEASVSLARMVHLGRISAAELPHHQGSLEDYWDQSIQEVELTEEVPGGCSSIGPAVSFENLRCHSSCLRPRG